MNLKNSTSIMVAGVLFLAMALFAQDEAKKKKETDTPQLNPPREKPAQISKDEEHRESVKEKIEEEERKLLKESFEVLKSHKYSRKLIRLTKHPDPVIRFLAVETLGDIPVTDKRNVNLYSPHILKVLTDFLDIRTLGAAQRRAYREAAIAATETLAEKGYRELIPALRRVFFESSNEDVQVAAAKALKSPQIAKYPLTRRVIFQIFRRMTETPENSPFYSYRIKAHFLDSMYESGDKRVVPMLVEYSKRYDDLTNRDDNQTDPPKEGIYRQARELWGKCRSAIEKHMKPDQYNNMAKIETLVGLQHIIDSYEKAESKVKEKAVYAILTILRKPNLGDKEYKRKLMKVKINAIKLLKDKDIFSDFAIREIYDKLFSATSNDLRMQAVEVLEKAKTGPAQLLLGRLLADLVKKGRGAFEDDLAIAVLNACGAQGKDGTRYLEDLIKFMKTRYQLTGKAPAESSIKVKTAAKNAIKTISEAVR